MENYYTGNYRIVTSGDAEYPFGAQLETNNQIQAWGDVSFRRKTSEEVKAWVNEYLAREMHLPEILESCNVIEQRIAIRPSLKEVSSKASAQIININEIRGAI